MNEISMSLGSKVALSELTVVLPTFNEAQNIAPLIEKLNSVLRGVRWEAVFVDDDSTDGTSAAIAKCAQSQSNIRIIRRIGRRGLSTAVVEGALSSMSPFIAVMDADLQHDEAILNDMLLTLRSGNYDLVVGTRYIEGGSTGDWSQNRATISLTATRIAQRLLGVELSDPMSGFFMLTRSAFETVVRNLSGQGFKILLDIVTSAEQPLRIAEKPFHFRKREFGRSKLDSLVAFEFLTLLLDKTLGWLLPVRFLLFLSVGAFGLLAHMSVLAIAITAFDFPFAIAQGAATSVAIVFNFFANNALTYRDRRIRGLQNLMLGLVSFSAVCSVGAVANVGIASFVFDHHYAWWAAGLAGVVIGAVWNYAATSLFTWKAR